MCRPSVLQAFPGVSAASSLWLLTVILTLLLTGCGICDECEQQLAEKQLELGACTAEKNDLLSQKNACLEQLNLVNGGQVLSYSCAVAPVVNFEAATARYITSCPGESSITLTVNSVIAAEGLAIALPGGGGISFPGGGAVSFPGAGGVSFPGGGGVSFPGAGDISFEPGNGPIDTDPVGETDEIKAYDVFTIQTDPPVADDDPDNGYFLLPGGKSRLRCVQANDQHNERVLKVEHDVDLDRYTLSCLDDDDGSASSILVTHL